MTSLLKKLSISIKIGVIKRSRVCLVNFHTADADATKQFYRVGVGGVYWALGAYIYDGLTVAVIRFQWNITRC